ncbi:hypothetical protein IV37_GL000174 [Fructilactobacillus fructivorans]|uniref:terminase small subunit n=1 Tax=Fructilactobacillus fructivorans TaxID=1614 RepID=UPI000704EBC6|nr:terminase small subunit [Fructilactobacillus fructivorans]KRN13452.1 hypothetical protein IV37_GL000174 [Fructilactobacillus fructivorans]
MSKRDDAKADYLAGISLKKIATKYGVAYGTVKSWKSRDKWDEDKRLTQPLQNKRNATKKGATREELVATREPVTSDELNDKQELFCMYYLQRFNGTWAYMKAYGANYETSMVVPVSF